MWKKLLNTDHFLLFTKDLEVYVTDYISIWYLQFTEASFLACLKDSNFGLEMDENELVHKGKLMLTNPEGLKSRLKVDKNSLMVTFTMSFGFPVWLEMKLTEGSKEFFFQKITLQLLKTIEDLRTSQIELRESLKKKDLEIEEYKCEGGEIALRFLKTIPFNDEAHVLKHPVYCENFGADKIPDCLLSKTVDVPETRVVKEEPSATNVKQEPTATNGTMPTILTENHNIKTEAIAVQSEDSIKLEPVDVKPEVKSESLTQMQSPSRTQTRPGIVGPSPSKRNRKKLNL